MKIYVAGVVLVTSLALAFPALGSPGQCRMSGYETFPCDVDADGGGLTFALPDGREFVFAHVANSEGLGYLLPDDAEAGARPQELGMFMPLVAQPGCWFGAKDDITFCVVVEQ